MKKIFGLILVSVFITAAASAQQGFSNRMHRHRAVQGFRNGEITRGEAKDLRRDNMHYKMAKRRALQDGYVGPMERRHLKKIKRDQRHDLYRYKHNNHRRVI